MSASGIDSILAQLRETAAAARGETGSARKAGGSGADFAQVLKSALDSVNQAQRAAEGLAARFELGDPGTRLHEVMIALQKANVSFQAMVEVRNRLVAAYHDIMNMQV
jgi:flagellar hook-basal body complex protein FliE